MASRPNAPLSFKQRSMRMGSVRDDGEDAAPDTGKNRKTKILREAKALGLDFLGAIIVLLIIVGALYAYTDNWPPLVVVQSGSMQHSEDESFVGVIDTGDLVFVKSIGSRDSIIPYADGETRGYRTYDSYGDVIIFRPNGEEDRTAIIHRAVMYLDWNETNYNLPLPITDIDGDLRSDLYNKMIGTDNRIDLNDRITITNRWTLKNILDQYPDDPNHDVNKLVFNDWNDVPLSTYIDFLPFSDAVVIEQMNTTRWNITEGDQYFEISETNGALVLYAFPRMGGGYDIDYGDLEPNQNGVVHISDYEWPENTNLTINIGEILKRFRDRDRIPHSGFITKGDKNGGVDQTSDFSNTDQPSWIEPVEKDWVIGKSVGEVPWFGIIKLWIEGKSNPPQNSNRNLIIAIVVIIAMPFLIDLLYNAVFRKKDEEDEDEEEKPQRRFGWFSRKKSDPVAGKEPDGGGGDTRLPGSINRSQGQGRRRMAPRPPRDRK